MLRAPASGPGPLMSARRGARRFFLGTWNMKGFLSEERPIRTLREVIDRLNDVYCSTTGYEARARRPAPPAAGRGGRAGAALCM